MFATTDQLTKPYQPATPNKKMLNDGGSQSSTFLTLQRCITTMKAATLIILMLAACAVTLCACGTTRSLDAKNFVEHAAITVNDNLMVTGPIASENGTYITIRANGVPVTYEKSKVKDIQRSMLPDADMMQAEVLRNSKNAATNSAALLGITLLSILIAVLSVSAAK